MRATTRMGGPMAVKPPQKAVRGRSDYHVGPALNLNGSQVYGNTSTGVGVPGAGVYTGGQATLRHSQVFANTARNTDPNAAAEGAGIFAAGGSNALIGTLVAGNRAIGPNAQAGGIVELGTAQVALTDSVVVANVPDNCGPPGAIPGCPD